MNYFLVGTVVLTISLPLYAAQFNEAIGYQIKVPAQSRFGVVTLQTSLNKAQSSCLASDLRSVTINNNNGQAGSLKGSTNAFQLAPCFEYGTTYWNPLAIVAQANPCSLAIVAPLPTNINDQGCQQIVPMLATGVTSSNNSQAQTQQQVNLMSQLTNYYTAAQNNPLIEKLYTTVKNQADFLVAMSQALQPNPTQGKDFLSVPYLRFAVGFADQYITSSLVEQASKAVFGDENVATYFPSFQFPVTLNLTKQQAIQEQHLIEEQTGSMIYGGVLATAKQQGYIDNVSAQEFLTLTTPLNPSNAAQMIATLAGTAPDLFSLPDYQAKQALLYELLFLQLSLMQPIPLGAGIENPAESDILQELNANSSNATINNKGINAFVATNNFSNYSGYQPYLTLTDLYTTFFNLARYMRALFFDNQGNPQPFAPQPVDTFYGALIINNGYSNGQSVSVQFGGTAVTTGQASLFQAPGGVDQWNVSGVNKLSGFKYRTLDLDLYAASGQQLSLGSIQLQIEQVTSQMSSDVSDEVAPTAGIALIDTVNNIRTTVYQPYTAQSNLIQQFFTQTPHNPWAVVVELANQPIAGGTVAPQPTFTVLGLVRLNPQEFPLNIQAQSVTQHHFYPFTFLDLSQAQSLLYNSVLLLPGSTIDQSGISVPETNMNLVKFNGALSYTWGGTTSLKNALNLPLSVGQQYITQAQINNATALVNTISAISTGTNQSPSSYFIPVATKSIALMELSS